MTRTEWGIRYEDPRKVNMTNDHTVTLVVQNEQVADQLVLACIPHGDHGHRNTGHRKVSREVTEWKEH